MNDSAPEPLDSSEVAEIYLAHAEELKRFLVGVLRDYQLASDVLQIAFTRLVERGHEAEESKRKSWLFRVAYNEALAYRRRQSVGSRAREKLAWIQPQGTPAAEEPLLRWESVEQIRAVLEALPKEQREVVRLRIYEEMTFAEIAESLGIPLGTALGRMRAAVQKMRKQLDDDER